MIDSILKGNESKSNPIEHLKIIILIIIIIKQTIIINENKDTLIETEVFGEVQVFMCVYMGENN
jgi:hypothetical protein